MGCKVFGEDVFKLPGTTFVHKAANDGQLEGAQLMLFTDNLVADCAFHEGYSDTLRVNRYMNLFSG